MELDAPLLYVSAIKVTSKGAGLNPNAKVWQEMPVASREVVTNSSHWPPADISDGERRHRSSERSPETTLSRRNRSAVVFWTSERERVTSPPPPGFSEPSSAGCKQFSAGFPALDDSGSTATAEVAVNGMDPPDLGFTSAEVTAEPSGQWRGTSPRAHFTNFISRRPRRF